jgi:ribosomal protein S12 methylthiotransferase accessory factor
LRRLDDIERSDACRDALERLHGAATVAEAETLLEGSQRFFGIAAPGLSLQGCGAHQRLLAAYEKQRVA